MLEMMMAQALQLLQHPYLLYGVLVTASVCLVFGAATLLEPRPAAAATVRRGDTMQWAVTRFSAGLVPEDLRERKALTLSLLQAGYAAPNAVQVYYGIRVMLPRAATKLRCECGLPSEPTYAARSECGNARRQPRRAARIAISSHSSAALFQPISNRSRFITLVQAAAKSCTNFCCASVDP